MQLVYKVKDRPPVGKLLIAALQQLLAILAATIAVPAAINAQFPDANMSASAALLGAGVGTIVYLLFTKFRSPVFLGSSFAFLGSMSAAFAGGVSMSAGYLGLLIGAAFAGLVYVVIAVIVKFAGVKWINKLMPAVVIGPTVAIIGLSLAGNAIGDLMKGNVFNAGDAMLCSPYVALLCGLVTLAVTMICSVYGKKNLKLFPFVIGILAGYALAAIFTGIGAAANVDALKIIDFSKFKSMKWLPDFSFIQAFKGGYSFGDGGSVGTFIGTIAVAYVPVAFVVFAEHIADHKNLSSIIGTELLEDPGLSRTLLGDGVGSICGAFFGGCANTTYGESIGCIAITGNASIVSILTAALGCMVLSFFTPFVVFINSIPKCVMGGACIALYGFIAVSGLQMLHRVDLGNSKNLFVVSSILVCGIGGLYFGFGTNSITGGALLNITSLAVALIVGIVTNLIVNNGKLSSGEDGLSSAASEMGKVDPETTEIPSRKSKKK